MYVCIIMYRWWIEKKVTTEIGTITLMKYEIISWIYENNNDNLPPTVSTLAQFHKTVKQKNSAWQVSLLSKNWDGYQPQQCKLVMWAGNLFLLSNTNLCLASFGAYSSS